ncbi:hypothetical protein RIF29_29319 [Crotalaria pallida]|uniref:Uncharacterized protein n=1 Tax=Crotalaria pallida TaxID=3830 RepID=A0AAN9HVT5_CROPI
MEVFGVEDDDDAAIDDNLVISKLKNGAINEDLYDELVQGENAQDQRKDNDVNDGYEENKEDVDEENGRNNGLKDIEMMQKMNEELNDLCQSLIKNSEQELGWAFEVCYLTLLCSGTTRGDDFTNSGKQMVHVGDDNPSGSYVEESVKGGIYVKDTYSLDLEIEKKNAESKEEEEPSNEGDQDIEGTSNTNTTNDEDGKKMMTTLSLYIVSEHQTSIAREDLQRTPYT